MCRTSDPRYATSPSRSGFLLIMFLVARVSVSTIRIWRLKQSSGHKTQLWMHIRKNPSTYRIFTTASFMITILKPNTPSSIAAMADCIATWNMIKLKHIFGKSRQFFFSFRSRSWICKGTVKVTKNNIPANVIRAQEFRENFANQQIKKYFKRSSRRSLARRSAVTEQVKHLTVS
ncbi:uncharacterized protein RAG0_13729 [Rhynchosporium agropyri]|uniref:Uncharacterized protein n=1 Tax=Rhynchosporium agropyri TaxID=914238 RepID=A0A1E1LG35_9HELO|nr:uncharacterized protein RAG0_13729 [Rhynchosporium agropyri]